ncbi:MAG: aspartate aminotransferase family protein [Planctomycetota bacterium]|nr:aspartate aminotransferase family protein [Planctomycetota bacterium]MED5400011.1 aspartate aminotransferase family protein [Planctomycetota bacterium]
MSSDTGTTEQLRQLAIDHLWQHNRDWETAARDQEPLIFVAGDGIRVTDTDGQTWIDVNGGYSSVNIGYGRTEIAEAAFEQLRQIPYFPQGSANPPTIKLAAKLAELAPGNLNRAFPVSGGSLANETALKVARAYQKRRGHDGRFRMISRRGSYHGATGGVLFLGSVPSSPRTDYEPAPPGMVYAPQPNAYRCELGSESREDCAVRCAQAIEDLIRFHGPETVAAVIAEPVASGPGAVMPDPIYWTMLRDICTRHGVLLIADEVITGFGRTGKLFAMEHFGIVPDIMTIAKGISSSYLPLGATLATDDVAAEFASAGKHLRHVFTFAGHPASAAAGLKNIELIQSEELVDNAARTGEYLSEKLHELQERHPIIGDVRGIGFMQALDLVADRETRAIYPEEAKLVERINARFKKQRLLIKAHSGHIINLSPPLCTTRDDLDEIVAGISQTLGEVEAELDS